VASEGSIEIISPENGDGETWYFEVTRYGEIWDGRADTEEQAREDADALLARLIQLQTETGRNHEGPIR
jgi:hypothetical protein